MSVGGGAGGSAETIRLEEYTGVIQNRLVAAWQTPDAVTPWLPTEFLLSQYITRILVTGRAATLSLALAADQSWTQVWRSPGAKEWSCLLGVLPHMPGPVLVVVGADVILTPKLVASLRATIAGAASAGSNTTICVLRQTGISVGGAGWAGDPPDQVFFPVIDVTAPRYASIMAAMGEWLGRTSPRSLDTKMLLPQLAAAGYGLCVAEGLWHWYKPADSPALATLTVGQIARQLHILAAALEHSVL